MPQARKSRSNHSKAKTSPSGGDERRLRILQAVLPQVPFDGWSEAAYARGLKQAAISRGEADLLFPQGVRDLIELFGVWADTEMQKRIKTDPGFTRLRVREKISFAVRARLEVLTTHREAVRRMMFWYALPTHIPLGVRRLYKTVDLMWRAAGDTATDFNFYTKRGLLAGVLKATILFWLDDDSAGCRASWEFLDRRIAEVLKVGKTISLMKEWTPSEIVEMVRKRVRRA